MKRSQFDLQEPTDKRQSGAVQPQTGDHILSTTGRTTYSPSMREPGLPRHSNNSSAGPISPTRGKRPASSTVTRSPGDVRHSFKPVEDDTSSSPHSAARHSQSAKSKPDAVARTKSPQVTKRSQASRSDPQELITPSIPAFPRPQLSCADVSNPRQVYVGGTSDKPLSYLIPSKSRHYETPYPPLHSPKPRSEKDESASSISGKSSISSRPGKCHYCGLERISSFEELAQCSSCTRKYHRQCHEGAPMQVENGAGTEWHCRRCIRKGLGRAGQPDQARATTSSTRQAQGPDEEHPYKRRKLNTAVKSQPVGSNGLLRSSTTKKAVDANGAAEKGHDRLQATVPMSSLTSLETASISPLISSLGTSPSDVLLLDEAQRLVDTSFTPSADLSPSHTPAQNSDLSRSKRFQTVQLRNAADGEPPPPEQPYLTPAERTALASRGGLGISTKQLNVPEDALLAGVVTKTSDAMSGKLHSPYADKTLRNNAQKPLRRPVKTMVDCSGCKLSTPRRNPPVQYPFCNRCKAEGLDKTKNKTSAEKDGLVLSGLEASVYEDSTPHVHTKPSTNSKRLRSAADVVAQNKIKHGNPGPLPELNEKGENASVVSRPQVPQHKTDFLQAKPRVELRATTQTSHDPGNAGLRHTAAPSPASSPKIPLEPPSQKPPGGDKQTSIACEDCRKHSKRCAHNDSTFATLVPGVNSMLGISLANDQNLSPVERFQQGGAAVHSESPADSEEKLVTKASKNAAILIPDVTATLPYLSNDPETTSRPSSGDDEDHELLRDKSRYGDSRTRGPGMLLKLIGMAYCDTPGRRLQARGVCEWIGRNIHSYKPGEGNWQACIHAQLSSGRSHPGNKRPLFEQQKWKEGEGGFGKGDWYRALPAALARFRRWDSVLREECSPELSDNDMLENVEGVSKPGGMPPTAGSENTRTVKVGKLPSDKVLIVRLPVTWPKASAGTGTTSEMQMEPESRGASADMTEDGSEISVLGNNAEGYSAGGRTEPSTALMKIGGTNLQNGSASRATLDVDAPQTLAQTLGVSQTIPRKIDVHRLRSMSLAEFIREDVEDVHRIDLSSSELLPLRISHDNFDRAAKLREISKRPSRKELFGKPPSASRIGTRPVLPLQSADNRWHPLYSGI